VFSLCYGDWMNTLPRDSLLKSPSIEGGRHGILFLQNDAAECRGYTPDQKCTTKCQMSTIFDKCPVAEFSICLPEFFFGIHDDRAIPRDGFFERLP